MYLVTFTNYFSEVYKCLWESCDFETPNSDEVTRHVNFHSYHTKVKCVGSLICKSWKLPVSFQLRFCFFLLISVNIFSWSIYTSGM